MAKNWTLKEAVKVVTAGKNTEALQELGKRYPITTLTIAKLNANEALEKLMSVMPDHVTMLKLERAFKDGAVDTDDDVDDEDVSEAVEDTDDETDDEQDLADMTSKQLYALCIKKGIKAKKYGVNKQYYLNLLNGTDASEEAEDADAEDENDGDDSDEMDYSKLKAPELYSLCKKRKINVEPRQKASVYIKALKDADAKDADDEEDWDEEEAPAKEEKKPAKASEKKPAKASKKKVAEEDDDEDWDI